MATRIRALAFTTLFASLSATSALAEGHTVSIDSARFYVGVQGATGPALNDLSYSTSNNAGDVKLDRAQTLGITAGVFLNENWRVGVDVNYFKIDLDEVTGTAVGTVQANGDTDGYNAFIDVGYETMLSDKFGVFAEAGIGFADSEVNAALSGGAGTLSGSDRILVGKVGFGSTYQFADNLELFSKYNYVFGKDADYFSSIDGVAQAEQRMHVFVSGLRLKLN